jgi:hypothetical protein
MAVDQAADRRLSIKWLLDRCHEIARSMRS